jgi:tetratricopeptide (TPR) repeat protein
LRDASKLGRAAALYRAGRLAEAEALFAQVLAADHDSADALFYLGSIATDAGRLGRALGYLRQAVARRPLEAAFHAALGNALARAGRAGEALASYRTALTLRPELAELELNAGHALRALGRHEDALAAYDRLLARQPGHAGARLGRAYALAALRRRDEALAEFEPLRETLGDAAQEEAALRLALGEADEAAAAYRALLARPGADPRLRLNIAAALLQAGRRPEAVDALRALEAAQPGDPATIDSLAELYLRAGEPAASLPHLERLLRWDERPELRARHAVALLELERHAAAADTLRRLVATHPEDADARANLGLALIGLDRADEALVELREALRLRPEHWQALHGLGLALLKRGEPAEGVAALERAHALEPGEVDLTSNLGYAYALVRDFERGEPLLREAAARAPAHRRARRNLALYHLVRGRFEEGWAASEGPWDEERLRTSGQQFPQPWWRGEALEGRVLLVWAEQGLGDQIMFCNPLPDLLARGERVVLQCEPRLATLFARSFPGAKVVAKAGAHRAEIDRAAPALQVPMSQLPVYLRRSRQAFPRHRGYLRADEARVSHWRGRLAALGPGPKVGISWVGGTVKTGKTRRSMTLEDWLPLLRLAGPRFVSLQYTDCAAELAWLREAHGIEVAHWQEAIDDYDETAALVAALDAVASVTTAVVHLAGALDRPAHVAVPWWPAWCFLLEGEALPWYPSVRLYRQPLAADWREPIERIAAEVRRLAPR